MFYSMERLLILFAIAAMLATIFAQAAEPARAGADVQKRFIDERANCQSAEDSVACRREAGAALQEARSGKLADANTSFESNKIARCAYLKGDDKEYCVRRMNGEGTTSGSVEGGGILRELTVTVPATGR
jgi:hypothetical protein